MKLLFIAEPFIWVAVRLYRRFRLMWPLAFAGWLLVQLVRLERLFARL